MTESETRSESIKAPSEDPFQILVENALDVIALLDENGKIIYQSPSVERVFGYTQTELMDRDVMELVHPEDRESTGSKLGKLLHKVSAEERHELRYMHKNGEWRYIEVQARYFEIQSLPRVVLNTRDVTENRKVLDELQLSNELFRTSFNANSNSCSLSKFDTGEFIDVNPAFERILGWSREEALSKTGLELNIWGSPENRELIVSRLVADGALSQLPFTAFSKTGESIEVLIDAKILVIAGSKCIYMSAMDITRTKKLEDQLRHSQKMEAVGQLTGGIAHDFNNLLSVILGNSELIQASLDPDSSLRSPIESILKATNRGAGLTHQLLAFSRKQNLQPIPISLNKAVEQTVSMLNQSLSEDIEIQTNIDDDLWPIEADPGQLENAILNLALNSRDAMPGGGTITISYTNKTIGEADAPFNDLPPGDYVSLAFADTGSGIPTKVLQQVFEPFFTTKETGRGTGLGLSMVFGFVNQSGGQVFIQSEQEEGTTVTILLPRSKSATADQAAEQVTSNIANWQGQTALLVEDNADVRNLTAKMLERIGFKVLTAEDGSVARDLLQQDPNIDFLLSDVILPGELKGPDVGKLVQAQFPEAAILLMSGFNPEGHHSTESNSENMPLISKPFTNEELVRRIQGVFVGKK